MTDMHDLFNRKLAEFIADLLYIYPGVDDFKTFKTTFEWATALDKTAPHHFFNACVVKPFAEKVLCRDETFFLCESYVKYNDYMKKYGHNLDIVQKLKQIWKTLDEHNKDNIWKYMQVLVYLANKCSNGVGQDFMKLVVPTHTNEQKTT
jgi:hypothetical protein